MSRDALKLQKVRSTLALAKNIMHNKDDQNKHMSSLDMNEVILCTIICSNTLFIWILSISGNIIDALILSLLRSCTRDSFKWYLIGAVSCHIFCFQTKEEYHHPILLIIILYFIIMIIIITIDWNRRSLIHSPSFNHEDFATC